MAYEVFQQLLDADLYDEAEVTLKDNTYEGVVIQARVDPESVPKEWHGYYLRDNDDLDGIGEIVNGVVKVNFFGMFYTKTELPLEDGESVTKEQGFDFSFL